jgi:endogenous inhibitor of DNA gyrase (YacG/DUF329 family)
VSAFAPRCPICRRSIEWEGNPDRPFCSERCRLIDLGSWAAERYRIAGAPPDTTAGEDGDDDETPEGSG